MAASEVTMRDDLEDAIKEVESAIEDPASEKAPRAEAQPASASVEQASSEEASAAKEADPAKPASVEDPAVKFVEDNAGYPEDAEKYPTLTADRLNAPPEGWRPGAREGWKELSEVARREIHRRELDIATGLQDATDARRVAERVNGLGTVYGAAMAAEGVSDPLEAAEGLFKTAAQLRLGTPQEKASRIVQLINHYGVDLELLDTTLASGLENGSQPAPLSPEVAAALKPYQEFMADMQGRMGVAQKETVAKAEVDLTTFRDTAEFVEDVRLEMADLLDVAANNGREMSLQQAYDAACQMNPEIRKILAARVTPETGAADTARVEDKVAAAAAIQPGKQAGIPLPKGGGSLRNDLENAIEQVEGR